MPLPSFRNSRSRVRRRRSHHALKQTGSVDCANCGTPILPHRACKSCGFYKGRNVKGASLEKAEKVIAKAVKTTEGAEKEVKKAASKKRVANKAVKTHSKEA